MPENKEYKLDPLAPDYYKSLGSFLKMLRKKAALNQTEVGNAIGVSYQQIQKYESGENYISDPRKAALSKLFGVDLFKAISDNQDFHTYERQDFVIAKLVNSLPVNQKNAAIELLKRIVELSSHKL